MILWRFIGPNGKVTDLTNLDGVDELGPDGSWMPPYELLTRSVPGGSGEVVEGVRAAPRTVTVPICVQAPDRKTSTLDDRLRRLADEMAPEDGPGLLVATRADDDGVPLPDRSPDTPEGAVQERGLRCWYAGGLELSRSFGDQQQGWWQLAGLVFHADRPYYTALNPIVRRYKADPPQFWFPLLPLVLGSDSLTGGSVELNVGMGESWPVVTIHAPGSLLVFGNDTTGQEWRVNTTDSGGQDITVDTRPTWLGGGRSVSRADGTSMYAQLAGDFWPMVKGENRVRLEIVGADPLESYALMSYFPQFRTP